MNKARSIFVLVAVSLSLMACSRLTPENYNKLEVGMPFDEVVSILGDPTECSAIVNTKACRWGDDKKHIDLKVVGESVIFISAKGME